MRPVCAKCGKEMRCWKNSVGVVHYMNNNQKDGIDVIVQGDLYKCPSCNSETVTGYGKELLGLDIPNQQARLDWYTNNTRLIEVKW